MARKLLTPAVLNQRPPTSGRVEVRDTLSPLVLRISPTARSFMVRPRIRGAAQPLRLTWPSPACVEELTAARAWALEATAQCKRGVDPRDAIRAAAGDAATARERQTQTTFRAIAENYFDQHASKLRSAVDIRGNLDRYLLAEFGDKQIGDISRADITRLLDRIAAKAPVQADRVLALLRKLMNWHETRDDAFSSPIVRGMARTRPAQRARSRVLSDEEIRLVWSQTIGTYGDIVRMLLLTAQRRDEVAQMGFSQIDAGGLWTIPAERYKSGRPQYVPLPRQARALVASRPSVDGSDLAFGAERDPHKIFKGWSKSKSQLDERITRANGGEAPPNWTLHDLRRTARTLMSRAGVRPEIAERVLGHAISGVEGVYDRHAYVDEKRAALQALADLLDEILGEEAVREAAE